MTTRERKEELRRHAAGLPQVETGPLFQRFLALPQVVEADTVMVFYGTGREHRPAHPQPLRDPRAG